MLAVGSGSSSDHSTVLMPRRSSVACRPGSMAIGLSGSAIRPAGSEVPADKVPLSIHACPTSAPLCFPSSGLSMRSSRRLEQLPSCSAESNLNLLSRLS